MGHYWQNSRKWQNRKNQICRSAMSSCSRLKKSSENSNIFAWHINVARFARNIVKWDLYEWFSNIWVLRQWYNVTNMTLLHTSKRWHCVRRWFLVWLIYQKTKYEHSSAVAHVDTQTEERSTTSLSSAEREAAKYTCSLLWWGQAECLILHAISKLLSVRGSQSLLLLGKRLFHAVRTRTVVCEFRMLALTKKNSSESNLTLSPFSLKAFRSVIVSTIRIKPHAGLLYSGIFNELVYLRQTFLQEVTSCHSTNLSHYHDYHVIKAGSCRK